MLQNRDEEPFYLAIISHVSDKTGQRFTDAGFKVLAASNKDQN